ncbi:MAG: carbohydrate ABC transporter permease [Eubacteriales bacterium]|nr:carbohydrate ABC transporter permease [Eubacteriales bacterium]
MIKAATQTPTAHKRISTRKLILTIVMALVVLTMMFPLLWMISTSFKVEAEVFNFPIEWIPKTPTVNNYTSVWTGNYHFGEYYLNSVHVTVAVVIGQLLICSMGAYAFAKMDFRFKSQLFALFLAMMMIPDQVMLVPRFMLLNSIKLYNTHIGIILMSAFSVYGVFLLRQSMVGIPDSIIEAARIDGANHYRIFFQIVLPISRPMLATLAIMRFVWTWNDYQTPLIFLRDQKLFTLQLGMSQFADQAGTKYALLMAASVLSILPLLLIFCFGQKNVVEGMAAGAVKG